MFILCIFVFHVVVMVFHLTHSVINKRNDVFEIVIQATKVCGMGMSGIKVLILFFHKHPIWKLRKFIINHRINSGDTAYDEIEKEKFNRLARTMLLIFYGLILFDTVLMSIPNPAMEVVYGLPPQLSNFGGKYGSRMLCFFYVGLIPMIFFPGYFSNIACVGVLLIGMRAKFNILANRYRRMANQAFLDPEHIYDRLNQELRETFIQQQEYWEHLKILKMLVSRTFFLVHYFSIMSIGTVCYIFRDFGMNLITAFFVITIFVLLLEYYSWCNYVSSFQDVVSLRTDDGKYQNLTVSDLICRLILLDFLFLSFARKYRMTAGIIRNTVP